MPFTPGHAAIILPFIRSRYFSATGLIVGSLSPDFEYFFKMSVNGIHSHTAAGLFYFDLPVTIFLAVIFHQVVKKNLIINLPPFLQRRFQDTLALNFIKYIKGNWAIFLLSALIGGASHIFWDSFTHNNRFFVRMFADFYQNHSVPFQGANYPMFYVLQQVSTVVGLLIVTMYILLKKPLPGAQPRTPHLSYWLIVLGIGLVVLRVRFWISMDDYNLGNVVVTSISGLLIGVICCGFLTFKESIHHQKSLDG
jgi:hypothetical protein